MKIGMSAIALLLPALFLVFACEQVDAVYRSYRFYYSYTYTYYYSGAFVSVGAIIGAIIGALAFIGLIVGLIVFLCCLRQRRMSAGAVRAPPPVPMTVGGPTSVATVSGAGGYPGAPGDYPKPGGYPGMSPQPPPPYPAAVEPAGYQGYQNGHQAPPYPTTPGQQMPPPLPSSAGEQQRF